MQVTVDIPDEFAALLVPPGSDPARLVLENSVAEAYRHRRLTMEQVRQILGFATRMEVDPFLQKYEICDYTVEDFENDIATMDRILQKKLVNLAQNRPAVVLFPISRTANLVDACSPFRIPAR